MEDEDEKQEQGYRLVKCSGDPMNGSNGISVFPLGYVVAENCFA